MTAQIIDGKTIAQQVRAEWKERADALKARGITPGMAVIIVGSDPASKVYVANKVKACAELGLYSKHIELASDISEATLLGEIEALNKDPAIHGILVQLPLPKHLASHKVIEAINPDKDVDGFHEKNVGALVTGETPFPSCTPYGVMVLLEKTGIAIEGKHAVVVGRSNIVGKPMALMLLHKHATVTICTSKTQDLSKHTRDADILVAAVGKANFITGGRQAGRRCGFCQREGSGGLHHAGARRRRADDHHHAGGKHGARGGTAIRFCDYLAAITIADR